MDHCADCGVAGAGVDGSVPGVDSGAVGEAGSAGAEGAAADGVSGICSTGLDIRTTTAAMIKRLHQSRFAVPIYRMLLCRSGQSNFQQQASKAKKDEAEGITSP